MLILAWAPPRPVDKAPVSGRPTVPKLTTFHALLMSLQGRGVGGTAGDVDSDLYFNPFAGSSQSSFSSAVKPKDAAIGTRPAYRRRGSEGSAVRRVRNDHDTWQEGSSAFGSVHARSRTLEAVVGSSAGAAKSHPLASRHSPSSTGSSLSSLADTRPRLKRLLSDLDPAQDRSNGYHDGDEEPDARRVSPSNAALKEKVVIVHEVRSQTR